MERCGRQACMPLFFIEVVRSYDKRLPESQSLILGIWRSVALGVTLGGLISSLINQTVLRQFSLKYVCFRFKERPSLFRFPNKSWKIQMGAHPSLSQGFLRGTTKLQKISGRIRRKGIRKKGELTIEHGSRVYANSGALIGDDKQSNYTKRAVSRRYRGRGRHCYDYRKAHVPGTRTADKDKVAGIKAFRTNRTE